jgi:hypothetical protein
VHFGRPELAGERDRRAWAQHLHQVVDALLRKRLVWCLKSNLNYF